MNRSNAYIPAGLPLISDYELFKTAIEYRHALSILPRSGSMSETRSEIEQALSLLHSEAGTRGITLRLLEIEEPEQVTVGTA